MKKKNKRRRDAMLTNLYFVVGFGGICMWGEHVKD
jgi:hypothetical protein